MEMHASVRACAAGLMPMHWLVLLAAEAHTHLCPAVGTLQSLAAMAQILICLAQTVLALRFVATQA